MSQASPRVLDVLAAKRAYQHGQNVTEALRAQRGVSENTAEIIETAYDLQAGTYIEAVDKDYARADTYSQEVARLLDSRISADASLLDVGTGELTTLSLVSAHLKHRPSSAFPRLVFLPGYGAVLPGPDEHSRIEDQLRNMASAFLGEVI
jgi:hypothetical protein